MATQILCDHCGNVLSAKNPNCVSTRIEFQAGKWTFQILVAMENCWNDGALCKKCIKKLFLKALGI